MKDKSQDFFHQWNWEAPADWSKIKTIDTHTGGEPLRIIISGLPPIAGNTVLEKRRFFMDNYDHLRTGILREPRGHADQYGAIITPAADDADLDVFFLNTEGYSPMCGHAILAITKVVFDTKLICKTGINPELIINVPPGRNYARATVKNGEVISSTFKNVPSFTYMRDKTVSVSGIGEVVFDVAFGGAFYAIVDANAVGVELTSQCYNKLIDYGRRIKKAVIENFTIEHPFESDLSSLFGVIFTGSAHNPANHSRNVTVFEDGEVDRSPTGTGISARAALLFAKGELGLNETIRIESILGSEMTVEVTESSTFGPFDSIIPQVGGTAHIMGQNELLFDPLDPLNKGFIFR